MVVFEGAFHGRTLLTLTMTHKANPYKKGFGPFVPDVYRMPFPNPYRKPMRLEDWERDLRLLVTPENVACVVVEPVLGEGGFVVPQEGFLPFLRDFTEKHGILLVLDEVQSGMGRTGKLFAHEHFGIEPDLFTLAKSLAAGVPLSAVVGAGEVVDAVGDSGIGGTYVGNPLGCAAALAVLDVIEEEGLLERAVQLGERLEQRFLALAEKHPLIGEVRGLGAMRAMELVRDRTAKTPATEETAALIRGALEEGLLLRERGMSSLMVEGGARVITSFLAARAVDRLVLTIAPLLVGGLNAVGDLAKRNGEAFPKLRNPRYQWLGPDLVLLGDLHGELERSLDRTVAPQLSRELED